jgi:hypothetical protein
MKNVIGFRTHTSIAFLFLLLTASLIRADVVQDAVRKVSPDQYKAYQVDIESMGLGLYGGPAYNQGYRNRDGWAGPGMLGSQEARLYLVDQLCAMGLEVSIQGPYLNVVAELPGVSTPGDIYIVCGHYDTTSGGERPGGDDNASGTAGVLEAARVLSQYRFNSTLRFIGFNAEEEWMKGSQDYVDNVVRRNGERVLGVVNLDMILRPAWDSDPKALQDLEVETANYTKCVTWAKAFIAAAKAYVPSLLIDPGAPTSDNWDAGDHGPFISAGYPAIVAIENSAMEIWSGLANAYYHSSEDASDSLANDPKSPSGVTYDYDFAADTVRATVATVALTAQAAPKPGHSFEEYQAIPTSAAEDLESFTIGQDQYLVAVNGRNDAGYAADANLYKWDGTAFVQYQSIPGTGAADCTFFTLDGGAYLAMANNYDGRKYTVDSEIYKWDGTHFVEFQAIPTNGASDWEFFAFNGDSYLAVANKYDGRTYNLDSKVYKWDGTHFAEFQSIPTNGASDWEFFTVDGVPYLAVANACDGATYNLASMIYAWNGTGFVPFQSIPTSGAADWESFTLDGAACLAVANMQNGATYNVDSKIYKWDGKHFADYQSVPTHGAADWEFFTLGDLPCLAVANGYNGSTRSLGSGIYAWNGTRFVLLTALPTHGAADWEFIKIAGREYLAAANSADNTTFHVASTLYRHRGPLAGNLDGDGDVDLHDYTVLAAAWRTREGQPRWNADCDIGVPADRVVDLRDLAVFVADWLKKPDLDCSETRPAVSGAEEPFPKR